MPLTGYLAQLRPLAKKMGMDVSGRLLFPQGAAEHPSGGDTLQGVAGKGGSEWHQRASRCRLSKRI